MSFTRFIKYKAETSLMKTIGWFLIFIGGGVIFVFGNILIGAILIGVGIIAILKGSYNLTRPFTRTRHNWERRRW